MMKPLLLLKSPRVNKLRNLLTALLLLVLVGIAAQSHAQVYYLTNDANKDTKSVDDALYRVKADGSEGISLVSGIAYSPTILQVDLPNHRAFVYETYSLTPPNGLSIKVIDLNTGAVTTTIPVTLTGRIQSIKYDPVNDYIYYVVQDGTPSTATANDALVRVKPDGTGSTTLISGFCKNPSFLALDIANSRVFVYENLFADHGFVTLSLSGYTASVARVSPTTAASGSIVGVDCDYDPVTDYIYLLTSDNTGSKTANDALYKIHSDGTGQVAIKSSIINAPAYQMALDAGNNKAYIYDNLSTHRAIFSVDLTTGNTTEVISIQSLPSTAVAPGLWVPKLASLTTTAATVISSGSVTIGGNIARSDVAVTERGVVYSSVHALPVIGTDTKQVMGNGIGAFSASITGLNPVATYYTRAYAISSAGTSYGDVKSFTTLSNNANLTSFTLSSGTLSPVFAPDTTAYTANVTYNVTSLTITPTVAQANASVKINNTTVASGSASGALSLNPGSNTITTIVTAQDGFTTKTYTTTITKDKTPQAITFNSIPAVTYGAADFTLGAVAASTLPITYTSDNDNVATVTSAGLVHIVGAGTVNITAAQGGNTTYLAASNVSRQLTVNKAVLTYTANVVSRDYGAANPTFTGSVTGFVNGDTQATATTGTMVFTSAADATSPVTTNNTNVIQYGIVGSGLNSANYSFVQATANTTALTLNKIVITYTAQPATKVYGAVNPALNVVFTGMANGQTIDQVLNSLSYATTATVSSPVGAYPITVSGLDALNYTFSAASSNATAFTVTKADLIFTAQAATKHYGETNPTLSGAITGYVNNETAATALTGTPVYSTTAGTASGVGSYPITLSGLSAANYNITAAAVNNTALTITKNTLSYVATPASRAFNTANPSVTGTVTGFLNGDTQASATTGTLSFSTTATTSTPVGTYAIDGAGLSSANYNIVQDASNASAFSIFLSTNGNLSSLAISQGSLSPSFASGTNNYTATVATGVTSLTLTPTLSDVNARVTVNGSQIISGTSSGSISLNVGPNVIPVNVTAQDGTTTNPYNVTVTRLPSSDATLNSFTISTGTPTPDVYNVYRSNVANTVTSFDVTAVVHEPNATITVNGNPATSGTPVTLPLNLGDNAYNLVVTAQDGTTQSYYGIVINRAFSSNNLLNSLALSAGSLSPAFDSATLNYTVQVSNATKSIDITPTFDATAYGTHDGLPAPSGAAFTSALAIGDNQVPITVTAQNGTPRTYNITVNRAASTDATLVNLGIMTTISGLDVPFDSAIYTYNTTVTSDVTAFTLKPIATNDGATITVNGVALNTATGNAVTLQYFSAAEPMVIVVTAGDGVTQKTYTVNVTRNFSTNNLLQSLTMNINGTITPLIPVFDPATNDYTMIISNPNVTGVVIAPVAQDSRAEVRVGGVFVATGTSKFVALQGGANVIPVNVLSFGGGTNTYNITINRAYSSDAGLINVILSGNAGYSAIINQATNSLTATIPNNVTAIRLSPNASDPGGTVITVNGYAISGGASDNLPLAVGDNLFTIGITAADNSNTQYYTVHAIRLPFVDVTLSSLAVDKGALAPAFSPAVTSYTVVVAASDNAITVTPVASAADASVTAGGQTINASTPSYTNSALFVGNQRITVRVTAPDGVNFTSYALNVLRPSASQAFLGNIVLSSGAISPVFSRNTVNYTASVAGNVSSVNFTPVTAEATSVITVTNGGNTTTITPATPSALIPLNAGANVVTTTIASQDGSTTKTYTVTITRAVPSTDATLASLGLSSGTLSPVFSSGTDTYTTSVNYATGSITITPAAANANALITIGGISVASGSGLSVPLNAGSNPIPVVVTAEDGITTKTYSLTVNRAAASTDAALAGLGLSDGTLSPLFDAGTIAYSATVSDATGTLTLSPFANDINATVLVNGNNLDVSGTIDIPLTVGANAITIMVKAQDSTTTKTYSLIVTRQSNVGLSNLTLSKGSLSPVFDANTNAYTAAVSIGDVSITVTPTLSDTTSTVKVNGAAVLSGVASAPVTLNGGNTIIPVEVTAADGITKNTYTITVSRPVSADASLTGLTTNAGSLNPVFNQAVSSYTLNVPYAVNTIKIGASTNDTNATVTANGTVIPHGALSSVISLNEGSNIISIVTTAQDGTTTSTYTLTVNRSAAGLSTNVGVSALTLSPASTLTVITGSSTINYQTSVSTPTSSITVTATTTDPNAVIRVEGNTVASGSTSAPITLNTTGSTTVHVSITAQDGATIRTYSIVVSKNGSSNPALASLSLNPTSTLTAIAGSSAVNYQTSVSASTPSITVTATAADPNAVIRVEGNVVLSGSASAPIMLNATGATIIHVSATAADGVSVRTYSITVYKNGSSNTSISSLALSPSTPLSITTGASNVNYQTSVSVTAGTVAVVAATSDPNAVIRIEGNTVASGVTSGPITLNATGSTIIHISITAEDGVSVRTYSIAVNKNGSSNALLTSLILSPASTLTATTGSSNVNYQTSVSASTSSITIKAIASDPNSVIRVEGNIVLSGSTSDPVTLNATGTTTVHISVTAENGVTTRTFSIVVYKNGSSNTVLTSLILSPASTLTLTTGSSTINYQTSVSAATTSITVKATASDPNAVIRVEGNVVASGGISAPITLNATAPTTIHLLITAADGTSLRTYSIIVYKNGSSNTALTSLALSPVSVLTLTTGSSTVNYQTSVSAVTSSITVKATASDLNSVIRVEGDVVSSGSESAPITLNASGSTTVHLSITAADGTSVRTYSIVVNKSDPGNMNLNSLALSPAIGIEKQPDEISTRNITVHQALSPNGDGINDVFIIDGIENYADNHLSIMNAGGVLIYDVQGYGSNGNVFDGHSNKNSAMQKPGTYYYSLEYKDGNETKRKTGYIILKY
jgi:gliding motility-associated-like protein